MKQYTVPLFVPFNIRNKILNDSKKDIDNYSLKEQSQVLFSYMKEKQIHYELEKRNYKKLTDPKNNLPLYKMGINHGFSQIGKFEVVERYYQGMGMKNVGFLGLNRVLDDTGLKAYWKFNEASGNIINQSNSAVDLGAAADIQITGATYSQSGKIGNSLLFDGVNDYGLVGTSVSQLNFLHNQTALFTFAVWLKHATISVDHQITHGATALSEIGFNIGVGVSNEFYVQMLNGTGGGTPHVQIDTAANYLPDATNWYFFIITADYNLASNQIKITRNDANLSQGVTTIATNTVNTNGTYAQTMASNSTHTSSWANAYYDEQSIWNRVLTATEQTLLYNSGNGREIY